MDVEKFNLFLPVLFYLRHYQCTAFLTHGKRLKHIQISLEIPEARSEWVCERGSLNIPYQVDSEIVFPPTDSSVQWFIPSLFFY